MFLYFGCLLRINKALAYIEETLSILVLSGLSWDFCYDCGYRRNNYILSWGAWACAIDSLSPQSLVVMTE